MKRNVTFTLVTDVDQDPVLFDPLDGAGYDLSVLDLVLFVVVQH